jgi:hypothetical protein
MIRIKVYDFRRGYRSPAAPCRPQLLVGERQAPARPRAGEAAIGHICVGIARVV